MASLEKSIRIREGDCPSFIIAGPQGSGKTHFTRLLMEHFTRLGTFDRVIVMTATPYDRDLLISTHNNLYQIELSEQNIEAVVEYQELVRSEGAHQSCLLVLDDWTALIRPQAKVFKKLASYSRHLDLSVIYVVQNITNNVPTAIRGSCKYWALFGNLSESELNMISEFFPDTCRFRGQFAAFLQAYREMPPERFRFVWMSRDHDGDVHFCSPCKDDVLTIKPTPQRRRRLTRHELARMRVRASIAQPRN